MNTEGPTLPCPCASYADCFDQIVRRVRSQRANVKRAARRDRWWQYAERASALYSTIGGLERVIAITLVSKVVVPVIVPTGQVFAHKLGIFATDDLAMLALLSSAVHYLWAIKTGSTLEGRTNYSPTDVFETFPRPELTYEMRTLGTRLHTYRRENVMLARNAGLTATYNLVHDRACNDVEIAELRQIHVAIDQAVIRAYGWEGLSLDHGFYDTRQGVRFTVGPAARQEIIDRLLALNHERYAAQQSPGAPLQGELF